ncbi:hypothetical protein B0O99DRAFT_679906 [Bisporella sp. PMI_857]|nr:hypothetical protein B0O99DRAFT_679906 [Bisporella sp. PMI_857]
MARRASVRVKQEPDAGGHRVAAGRVEKRQDPRSWDPQSPVITLYAGPNGVPLLIHKDLACKVSPVFKAALTGRFTEHSTQTYTLDDTSEACCRMLVKWSYSQDLVVQHRSQSCINLNKELKAEEDMTLAELYVLADRLLIPKLQNRVIREIELLRNRFGMTNTKCLSYVWENTAPESPLRKLLVQQCAFNMHRDRLIEDADDFPREMLLELTLVLMDCIPKEVSEEKITARKIGLFEVEET